MTGARLISLDVFRGFIIASMILVNNPGSWKDVYAPLLHAEWHGWTFTDIIFPSFLWIVGVAMTLSFSKRLERGDSRGRLIAHVLRRSAILFALGLFLNAFPEFRLGTLRIPGVLQRIAVCYLAAALIYMYARARVQALAVVVLCAVYWLLMTFAPVPGCVPGSFEQACNFAKYVDGLVLSGHMWSQTKTWDPEGIVSTLPAIATVLLGALAARLLRKEMPGASITSWLFFSGNALIVAGLFLSQWMPVNKNLWTVSFTLLMAGVSQSLFAASYWLVDIQGWKRWTAPFAIYGMNAITVYVLSGILADLLNVIRIKGSSLHLILYRDFFSAFAGPKEASLLFAITHVLALYVVAHVMYRRNWVVRL